jgi:LCP family protein required for cell wall assembly
VHARRTRPDTRPPDRRPGLRPDPRRGITDPSIYARRRQEARPADGRRVATAALSAVVPGLGQLVNGQTRLAAIFALPSLALLAFVWLALQLYSPTRLAASLISPAMLTAVLLLNVVAMVWRMASVGQAFFDRSARGRPGQAGAVALVLLLAFVAVPHLFGLQVGFAARDTFARIFEPAGGPGAVAGATGLPGPGDGERTNILVIGIDKTPSRTATLTDTMIVVSVDPVGRTVSMVSVPRDIVGTPLGNGDVFGPKLNSLMSYADAHPREFPQGGVRTLKDAVSALLGIPIHYHAAIDFFGFVRIVDALGGVDVAPTRGFTDPEYGYRGRYGFSITAGRHHLDGLDALAYVRARRAAGESDFTRAARQQEVIVALRDRAIRNGSLLFQLPTLFDALGNAVRTDLPVDRLPQLAVLADEVKGEAIVRIVIQVPLVEGGRNKYGAVQFPDLTAIRAVADGAFSDPGSPPRPWPTPRPTPAPRGSTSP